MGSIDVSVVIPSHGRRLRLRWLLNALEEQSLERERFEVIVVHDYGERERRELFDGHPLAESGTLREIGIEPGTGNAARQRNLGWRAARASLVAFTDDDCRPEAGWLEAILAAASATSGAVVQGKTRPDPLEVRVFAAPHHRSLYIDPPGPFAQTCNIAYPRELLERLGGFDEGLAAVGEDLDLALRAGDLGAGYVGAKEALVFHAVESYSLAATIRLNFRWQHVPDVVRRHPRLRRRFALGIFWRRSNFELCLAGIGIVAARRQRIGLLLALPYLWSAVNARGPGKRARLASTVDLPGRIAVDAMEVVALAKGSARYRTLVL